MKIDETNTDELESYVFIFGEKYRKYLTWIITHMDESDPIMEYDNPFERTAIVFRLIGRQEGYLFPEEADEREESKVIPFGENK